MNVKNGKSGVRVVKDGKLSADIIAPIVIDESNLNNCSIVLRLTYGDNTFLFTGDAETGEMDTVKEDISADVLKVGKVDVDQEPELARRFGIMSIPTLILFKNGEAVKQTMGFQPKDALLAWIEG